MAAAVSYGTYNGVATTGINLVDTIKDHIENTLGIKLNINPFILKQITIYGNESDSFEINGFSTTLENGVFSMPTNGTGDFVNIENIFPDQTSTVRCRFLW